MSKKASVDLPPAQTASFDVLYQIFSRLDTTSLLNASEVCKWWYQVSSSGQPVRDVRRLSNVVEEEVTGPPSASRSPDRTVVYEDLWERAFRKRFGRERHRRAVEEAWKILSPVELEQTTPSYWKLRYGREVSLSRKKLLTSCLMNRNHFTNLPDADVIAKKLGAWYMCNWYYHAPEGTGWETTAVRASRFDVQRIYDHVLFVPPTVHGIGKSLGVARLKRFGCRADMIVRIPSLATPAGQVTRIMESHYSETKMASLEINSRWFDTVVEVGEDDMIILVKSGDFYVGWWKKTKAGPGKWWTRVDNVAFVLWSLHKLTLIAAFKPAKIINPKPMRENTGRQPGAHGYTVIINLLGRLSSHQSAKNLSLSNLSINSRTSSPGNSMGSLHSSNSSLRRRSSTSLNIEIVNDAELWLEKFTDLKATLTSKQPAMITLVQKDWDWDSAPMIGKLERLGVAYTCDSISGQLDSFMVVQCNITDDYGSTLVQLSEIGAVAQASKLPTHMMVGMADRNIARFQVASSDGTAIEIYLASDAWDTVKVVHLSVTVPLRIINDWFGADYTAISFPHVS
eukprot:Clim_evm14s5 gene=Clim_evmTU14s5